jgi:predicted outer membrane repeat protein
MIVYIFASKEKILMKALHSKSRLHRLTLICMLIALIGGTVLVTPANAAEAPSYAIPAPDGKVSGLCDSWKDACDLQYALTVAGERGAPEIWVKEGTYTPINPSRPERTDTFMLKAGIPLYGGFGGDESNLAQRDPAAHVTILSGDIGTPDVASDNSYHVVSGANGASVDGFTISGGNANGSNPNDKGGGIYNPTDTLTVSNCIFSGNSAGYGGGINNTTGTLTVMNSSFTSNSAVYGSGIYNNSGTLTVRDSTFSGNNSMSSGDGGGIFNLGTLTVSTSTFSGNNAGNYGGGISTATNTLNITNSTFSGNSADKGGGVYANGTVNITNSTFSGNSASSSGSGIYNNGSDPVTLRNTIIANSANGVNCVNTITNGGNNIEDGATCGWGSVSHSKSNTNPLLDIPLADNGGPTLTFALLSGSPAINAGDDTTCNNSPVNGLDQRGIARPQGLHCDIGSFELELPPVYLIFLPLVFR